MTLEKAVSEYLQYLRPNIDRQRWDEIFRTLHRLTEILGGDRELSALVNVKTMEDGILEIKNQYDLRDTSTYAVVIQIKNFLKFCKENELINKRHDINLITNFRRFREAYYQAFKTDLPESIYPFDEEEMCLYWLKKTTTLNSLRNAVIINLLFETGITLRELVNLKKNSVKGRKVLISGKNKRSAKISALILKLITAYIEERDDFNDYLIINHLPKYFTSSYSLSSRSVEIIVDETAKAIESLIKITPNTIRQSYAAKLFAGGKSRGSVQRKMGYKNYNLPQLNRLSIASNASINTRPEKNVRRYLSDFRKVSELASEHNISQEKVERILKYRRVGRRYVSRSTLLRESDVLTFLNKLKDTYKNLIAVPIRQKEWNLSKDVFKKYRKINPEKFKTIDKILYMEKSITKGNLISTIKINQSF